MKIGIVGITGRMGRAIANLAINNEITDLVCGITRSDDPLIGKRYIGNIVALDDIGVAISSDFEELFIKSDVVIDFSTPQITLKCAELAKKYKKNLISGTTGLNDEEKREIK